MKEMTDHLVRYTASLPKPRGEHLFGFLTKDEFKQVLRNKSFVSAALENDTININWAPILVKTEEDIEFAAMNNQNVLLEGLIDNPIALSIFTCPLPIPGGKARSALDFFICKPNTRKEALIEHLAQHLIHFNKCNECNIKSTKSYKEMHFEIFTYHEDIKEIQNCMQTAGVGDKQLVFGKQRRDLLCMHIHMKNIK